MDNNHNDLLIPSNMEQEETQNVVTQDINNINNINNGTIPDDELYDYEYSDDSDDEQEETKNVINGNNQHIIGNDKNEEIRKKEMESIKNCDNLVIVDKDE